MQLLQSESLRYLSLFQPPQMNLTTSDISPSGLHVVTAGSKPFDLIMFGLNNSKLDNKFRTSDNKSHTAQVSSVHFTNDSSYVVSTSMDSSIFLWEVYMKKELQFVCQNTQNRQPITGSLMSKDSQFVLTAHQKGDNPVANLSIWHIDYAKKKITLVN